MASAQADWKALKCRPPDRFEDGTGHFLGVAALQFGFDFFERCAQQAVSLEKPTCRHHHSTPGLQICSRAI